MPRIFFHIISAVSFQATPGTYLLTYGITPWLASKSNTNLNKPRPLRVLEFKKTHYSARAEKLQYVNSKEGCTSIAIFQRGESGDLLCVVILVYLFQY